MKKIYLLLPLIALLCGFVACSDDDEDMRIELASPKDIKVTTELATATFEWPEIDKTGGYAYALDDSEDYTFIDASETQVTISGLSSGAHIFKIYAVGEEGKSFDSKVRQLDFEVDPKVSTPVISYGVGENPGDIVVSWKKVNGAVGYTYNIKDAATWTEVEADVLSITLTGYSYKEKFSFKIKALGDYPISEDSEIQDEIINMTTAVGVWAIYENKATEAVELIETGSGTGIYNATIPCLATDKFFVNIENKKYGFMSYSGNGGIGTVNSDYAAVPYYNNKNGVYYVRESNGLIEIGGNNFYTNMSAACKVFVQININGEKPSYYLQLVNEKPDTSIILEQYFDLMAYGGDWVGANKGGTSYVGGSTITPTNTGLNEGKKDGAASGTAFGSSWLDATFPLAFVKNRGMEGWYFENIFEFPGYIRLSNSNKTNPQYGVLTTPKFNVAGNMNITFDGLLFAAFKEEGINGFIEVTVLNGGKITSAKVVKDGSGSDITIQPVGNSTFHIISAYHTNYSNPDNKSWSNYSFVIEGATADTQITWNCKTDKLITSAHYRYCLDNIVVKKK